LGIEKPVVPAPSDAATAELAERLGRTPTASEVSATAIRDGAHRLAWLSMWDIAAFFAVLMVGFAYVWRRGDLDWVRAMTNEKPVETPTPRPFVPEREPAMMA
jgi:NADH-quinone oxidoreductase subunit A